MESPTKFRGNMQIEEREGSPRSLQGRRSQSPPTKTTHDIPVNGQEIVSEEFSVKQHHVGSPPKPKRTYEVDFVEPEKENVPVDEPDNLNVSDIHIVDSSPASPLKINGYDSQVLTPAKSADHNRAPQATSTPVAPNGILSTGRGRHSSGPCSKYSFLSGLKSQIYCKVVLASSHNLFILCLQCTLDGVVHVLQVKSLHVMMLMLEKDRLHGTCIYIMLVQIDLHWKTIRTALNG